MAFATGNKVSVKYVCSSQPAGQNMSVSINVMHYLATNVAGAGCTEQEAADGFSGIAAAPYKTLFNTTSRYEGTILQIVRPLPAQVAFKSLVGNGAGAVISEQLPMQTCGIVTKFTGFAGRRFRGRLFVPYPLELDNTNDQVPTPAYLVLAQNLAIALVTSRTFGVLGAQTTFDSIIIHPVGIVPDFNGIVSVQAREYWATQRRRSNAFKGDTLPL